MKTRDMIKQIFDEKLMKKSHRKAALKKLIGKLETKEKKLKGKLKNENSTKGKKTLKKKIRVNEMHQKKAIKLRKSINS